MLTIRAENSVMQKYTVLQVDRYYVNSRVPEDAPPYKEVDTEIAGRNALFFEVGVEKEFSVIYVMNEEGRTVDVIR